MWTLSKRLIPEKAILKGIFMEYFGNRKSSCSKQEFEKYLDDNMKKTNQNYKIVFSSFEDNFASIINDLQGDGTLVLSGNDGTYDRIIHTGELSKLIKDFLLIEKKKGNNEVKTSEIKNYLQDAYKFEVKEGRLSNSLSRLVKNKDIVRVKNGYYTI